MIKGLEVGRQGATSERVWLGREWKEWKVGACWESRVWHCVVFSSLFKTHLRKRLLSPPRCREIVKEMTRAMLRQHSHPPSATGLSGPELPAGPYLTSICSASSPSAITEGEKNISLRAFCKEDFFFFLERVLKYTDLWLVVEFIKVIFPDAIILGPLTHQGSPYPPAPSPEPAVGTNPHPRALAQACVRQLTASRTVHSLSLQQPGDVAMAGAVLPI